MLPGYKKLKKWLLIFTLVLCITVAAACSADKPMKQSAAAEVKATPELSVSNGEAAPREEDINGIYEFEDNVYTNMLSSFIAMKGQMPCFSIADETLTIIDEQNDTMEEFAGVLEPFAISQDDFDMLFQEEIVNGSVPDIGAYSKCEQYAVYKDEYQEYRVYLMDDEVWLATLSNGHMWSIYRLVKMDESSVGIIGGADGPTKIYVN